MWWGQRTPPDLSPGNARAGRGEQKRTEKTPSQCSRELSKAAWGSELQPSPLVCFLQRTAALQEMQQQGLLQPASSELLSSSCWVKMKAVPGSGVQAVLRLPCLL